MPWVVFDIGGVMVRIRGTWGECADSIGVSVAHAVRCKPQGDFAMMDPYQSGDLGTAEFVSALSDYLGVADHQMAVAVHNGMLAEHFDGIISLVEELGSAGQKTACLSNTNALHWPILRGSGKYPGIDNLDLPTASHLLKLAKPDPEIYASFQALAKAKPEELFYFDDHPAYVAAAQSQGWNAFVIDPLDHPTDQIRSALALSRILPHR